MGIGVIGLFLPILQGILFLVLGFYIISLRSEKAKVFLDKIFVKFPFLEKATFFTHEKLVKVGQKFNIL